MGFRERCVRTAAGVLLASAAAWSATAVPAWAQADPFAGDPYKSHVWTDMRAEFLGRSAQLRYESRVQVQGPAFAEDPMNVPIAVRVDPSLGAVQKIVVLVDRNPIKKVLEYQPMQALPALAFRFKLEQSSPVRAAVQLADGSWAVGGTWVESVGGGCTVSGATRKDGSWSQLLGQVNGRLFDAPAMSVAGNATAAASGARLRLQVMHPMDTGLVAGVPAFFVNRLSVRDKDDRELARLMAFEPVSENPVFSFDFAKAPQGGISVVGTDNNGNRIARQLP